jgi:uncharacterized protein (DUF885 family)
MTSTESQFYADAQALLEEILHDSPVTATLLGDHRFDGQLGDYSLASLEDQLQRIRLWLKKLVEVDTQAWALDSQIDHTLIVQILKQQVRHYEKEKLYQRNPGLACDEVLGGAYGLIIRDFAPLPERLKNVAMRLNETPRVLGEFRLLVDPPQVPKIWAEIALESAQQGVGMFAAFIPMLAEAAPDLKGEILPASQKAAAALQDYATWIEQDILPRAHGNYAVGKADFDEILREDHLVDYDAAQLLETGWKLLLDTEQQMHTLAAGMDGNKTVKELLEYAKSNHPTAEGLLDAYRESMLKARQFVIDHAIASIPEGEQIRVVETPPYLRPIIPYAGYSMPGFLEKIQEGIFMVTPVDEGADPEAAERKLRGHPWGDIPVTALHEAYPGHHLQLVVSNTTKSIPRKFGAFLSTLFVEGWAFYCEELMDQLGFIGEPIQKLSRLQAQQWRACRIIIDASIHTGKMTVEEAIDLLVNRAGLEPDDAKAEVRRYTQSPTQPQSYLMGKLQILEIVDMYKSRFPQASMLQMHDDILGCGSLPPRLMRQRLFGNQ